STFMADAGLLGAGAGSVNFWTSRQLQANSNFTALDSTGGVSFWDDGQMEDRLYSGSGIRQLKVAALGLFLKPTQLPWGNVNLAGSRNPISLLSPKRLLYGDISYWTASDHIVWSDNITSPAGQHIVWSDHIVWR